MAGAENNNSPVEFEILRSDSNGEAYVINTVLNFCQRKLRVYGLQDAKLLAHHVFNPVEVNQAREILHALWLWRDLPSIADHDKVVSKLTERRQLRHSNFRLVSDILEFFEKEDSRLQVTFLTLKCEDIPSKVT